MNLKKTTISLPTKLRTRLGFFLLAFLALSGCAKQGMPTGGQKDVTPPQMRLMSPPNSMLNSNTQEFTIEFDEYVVIKDADNNILVSPPMKERPEVKTKGKGIKVTIKDTLQPNTTYLFQFKEAIADFTEGNLLPSIEYVFSTGDYIDSMTLGGKVVEALSMEHDKDPVSVWLFDDERYQQAINAIGDTNISAPQPNYITRSNKEGVFCFNNIKPGRYHIVAIKDDDKNVAVDIAETVAFLDTTVTATVMISDTTTKKTISKDDSIQSADTVKKTGIDSTAKKQTITLRLSTPDVGRQRLTSSKFTSLGKVVITSLSPLQSPLVDAGGEAIVWHLNNSRDTLSLWTLRKECDSLQLIVNDSTGINDTLQLKYHKRRGMPKGGQINAIAKDMTIKPITSSLPYYDTLRLVYSTPLDTTKCRLDSVAQLMLLKDSSIEYCNAAIDNNRMQVLLPYRFSQAEKYVIKINPGSFTDIYNTSNDSLQYSITVTKAEDYGNLTLTIDGEGAVIVEIIDEKGQVAKTKCLDLSASSDREDGNKVKFDNLKPAKYRLRVINDDNGNGKWDAGNFASQRQPEKVTYLDKTLVIRANWDFNEKISVNN